MRSALLFLAISSLQVIFISTLTGCADTRGIESEAEGKTIAFMPGRLNFDIEAAAVWDGPKTGIDLYLAIPPPSLTYLKADSAFRAIYEIMASVHDRRDNTLAFEEAWDETTATTKYELTQRFDPILLTKRLAIPPGSYNLEVRIDDAGSRKWDVRTQYVEIAAPGARQPALGRILFESRSRDGLHAPLVPFHLPYNLDSLRAVCDAFNIPAGSAARISISLLRFRADTSVARPPFEAFSSPYAEQFERYDVRGVDSIRRYNQVVVADTPKVRFTVPLDSLREGTYQLDMSVVLPGYRSDGGDTTLSAHRLLSLMSFGFPRPVLLDELIRSMRYVVTNAEMLNLRSAPNLQEKRKRFEAFWLTLGQNTESAAALLKRYFARVEEANRYFTSTKEGWKTDRGMLYIVLGAPVEIQRSVEAQVWLYGSGSPADTFVFRRETDLEGGRYFEEYVLVRQQYYDAIWNRMITRWRRNEVL